MAFRHTVDAAVAPLCAALEEGDWKRMGTALAAIPTKAEGDNPAVAIETLRVAADALIEECSFHTAFERAFTVRRALHRQDVSSWLVSALANIHPASPVLRRLVMLTEMLATTEEGRSKIGRARGVYTLVKLWRNHPRSIDIVSALCTLCAGHIDNVSRMMRNGGVGLAIEVLEAIADRATGAEGEPGSLDTSTTQLLERTLLLLGLVCICTPDSREDAAALVPVMMRVIRVAKSTRSRKVLTNAIGVLGNVGEIWMKEGNGYVIPADCDLLSAVTDAWVAAPRDRSLASSAAWALCGLFRVRPLAVATPKLRALLDKSSEQIAAVRALQESLNTRNLKQEVKTSESTDSVSKSNERRSLIETVPLTNSRIQQKGKSRQKKTVVSGRAKVSPSKRKSVVLENVQTSPSKRTRAMVPLESDDDSIAPISRPESPVSARLTPTSPDVKLATPTRPTDVEKEIIVSESPTRIQDVHEELQTSVQKVRASNPRARRPGRPRKRAQ